MQKYFYHFFMVVLLVLVWISLVESINMISILSGLFFSLITILLIRLLQQGENVLQPRYFNPWNLLIYAVYLTGQIYVAGFQMIRLIFFGRMHIELVEVETTLKSDLAISVLACSITLTPGTVTVMRERQSLKVLCIDCETHDPATAGSQIKKELENILLRPEKKLEH